MENKEEKVKKQNRLKGNKGQWAIRIIAGLMAFLMILSVCISCVYYFVYYMN